MFLIKVVAISRRWESWWLFDKVFCSHKCFCNGHCVLTRCYFKHWNYQDLINCYHKFYFKEKHLTLSLQEICLIKCQVIIAWSNHQCVPYKVTQQIPKLILIAYKKYLLLEINTITKILPFIRNFILAKVFYVMIDIYN